MARRAFALVIVLDVDDDELAEDASPLYYAENGAELLDVEGINVVSMESTELDADDTRGLAIATARALGLVSEA